MTFSLSCICLTLSCQSPRKFCQIIFPLSLLALYQPAFLIFHLSVSVLGLPPEVSVSVTFMYVQNLAKIVRLCFTLYMLVWCYVLGLISQTCVNLIPLKVRLGEIRLSRLNSQTLTSEMFITLSLIHF